MIRFAKDVDAALMRPSELSKLRLVSSRLYSTVSKVKKSLFLIKTIPFAKDVDAALMRPDAALRTTKRLILGFGSVRAASGPHPFLDSQQMNDRAGSPRSKLREKI